MGGLRKTAFDIHRRCHFKKLMALYVRKGFNKFELNKDCGLSQVSTWNVQSCNALTAKLKQTVSFVSKVHDATLVKLPNFIPVQ